MRVPEVVKFSAERQPGLPVRMHRSRFPGLLLGLLLTVALAGCGGAGAGAAESWPGGPFPGSSGSMDMPGPVSDLELQTLVPPGSIELTAGPVHGTGPAGPGPVSMARVRGHRGVLHAVFLCQDAGHQVRARYTWYNSYSDLPCDPGPDTMSTAVGNCSGAACPFRNAFIFALNDAGDAVPPNFTVPAGASWTMLAWLAPPAVLPGTGVSAAGAGLSRFAGYGLDFTYPRSWGSLVPAQLSGDQPLAALVFEGSARMHDSCPLTTVGPQTSGGFPCGRAPVGALAPGGVLVAWSTTIPNSAAGGSMPGNPVTIAGRPGGLISGPASEIGLMVGAAPDVFGGPSCQDLGATWVVAATVNLGPAVSDQMLACLRGPGTGTAVAQVLAMLTSLRFYR